MNYNLFWIELRVSAIIQPGRRISDTIISQIYTPDWLITKDFFFTQRNKLPTPTQHAGIYIYNEHQKVSDSSVV